MRRARPLFAAPSFNRILLEGVNALSESCLYSNITTAHSRRKCRGKYSILRTPQATSAKHSLSTRIHQRLYRNEFRHAWRITSIFSVCCGLSALALRVVPNRPCRTVVHVVIAAPSRGQTSTSTASGLLSTRFISDSGMVDYPSSHDHRGTLFTLWDDGSVRHVTLIYSE
jgi:hypothetical protein